MTDYGITVHGGVGSPEDLADGCRRACEAGHAMLERGESAFAAAIEAVRVMEDDGRFNAGAGSALRLDGTTRLPAHVPAGIIGISRAQAGSAANRTMPRHVMLSKV